jgi:hypothetical protein
MIDGGRCLAPGTHTIVNQGSDGYIISGGGLNAPLTLCRGSTYTFAINAPGHPFFIRQGANDYNDGVTNNRASIGDLVFAVPMTAPAMLAYQCTAHDWMTGAILIVD